MGVHCYLTELGALVAMAAKIVAVISILASLAAAEPGYGGVALHPYGGSSSVYRTTQGLTGYGGYGYGGYGYGGYYGKRSAEPGYYVGPSSFVHQSRPYYHGSYGYGINHYGKRSADAGYYGYGVAGSYPRLTDHTLSMVSVLL